MTSRTDVALTEQGRSQADDIALSLKDLQITHLLTSPLARARSTAETIRAATGIEVWTAEWLIEQDFGPFEGVREDSSNEDFRRWRSLDGEISGSGVEPARQVFSRAQRLLVEDWSGLRVAVTHGCLSRIVITGGVLGQSPQEFRRLRLDPGQLAIISMYSEGWRLTAMNISPLELANRIAARLPL